VDGASNQYHNISNAGLHTNWVLITLIVPELGKIRIDVTIKLEIHAWLKGESSILDALQVLAYLFYSLFVACT
jgi:hypothetical protein